MKHIKTKKLFESEESELSAHHGVIRDDIDDICLELQDDGFAISFGTLNPSLLTTKKIMLNFADVLGSEDIFYVCIEKCQYKSNPIPYRFIDVKEVCERIKDYLGDKYKEIFIRINSRSRSLNQISFADDYNDKEIPENMDWGVFEIKIYFTI